MSARLLVPLSLALGASLAATLACGETGTAPVGVTGQRVLWGQPSGSEDDAVVRVIGYKPDGGGVTENCTGTMIAPNLVLTAKHCVGFLTSGIFTCSPDGTLTPSSIGGRLTRTISPDGVVIKTGPGPMMPTTPVAAVGQEIIAPASDSICMNDFAIVLLDRSLTDIPFLPVRLLTPIGHGENIRVVGYGLTEDASGYAERHTRSDLAVSMIGKSPLVPTGDPVPPSSFVTEGPALCEGDSGGPALSQPTDGQPALLGPWSKFTSANCTDTATRDMFVQLSAFKTEVCQAFAKAGFDPWLEGTPGPSPDGCLSGTGGSGGAGGDDAGVETAGSDQGGAANAGTSQYLGLRKKGGCNCNTVGGRTTSPAWALLPLVGAFALRRRRRRG
jgi:MYXO-CTERM domain-containing protein